MTTISSNRLAKEIFVRGKLTLFLNSVIDASKLFIVSSSLLALSACAPRNAELVGPRQFSENYFHYTIRGPGEFLSSLSLWFTGSEANWKSFFVSAKHYGPTKLRRGDDILIPRSLLIRSDPPSENFIQSRRALRAKAAKKNESQPMSVEEPTAIESELESPQEPPVDEGDQLEREFLEKSTQQ